jgi:hypothetical protein
LKQNEPAIRFDAVVALKALIELTRGGFTGQTAPFVVMCPGHLVSTAFAKNAHCMEEP